MTRLIGWLSGVVREPHTQSEIHFHSGPEHQPAPCFDARCESPRLEL